MRYFPIQPIQTLVNEKFGNIEFSRQLFYVLESPSPSFTLCSLTLEFLRSSAWNSPKTLQTSNVTGIKTRFSRTRSYELDLMNRCSFGFSSILGWFWILSREPNPNVWKLHVWLCSAPLQTWKGFSLKPEVHVGRCWYNPVKTQTGSDCAGSPVVLGVLGETGLQLVLEARWGQPCFIPAVLLLLLLLWSNKPGREQKQARFQTALRPFFYFHIPANTTLPAAFSSWRTEEPGCHPVSAVWNLSDCFCSSKRKNHLLMSAVFQ